MPNKHKLTYFPRHLIKSSVPMKQRYLRHSSLTKIFTFGCLKAALHVHFNPIHAPNFLPAFETHTLREACQYIKK